MDDDRQNAFMTALVTEHFVLQGARGQTNGEMTGRAALYLATVSSTLIALGFVARRPVRLCSLRRRRTPLIADSW